MRPNPQIGSLTLAATPTRESVTTILPDGSRPFLFPTDPRGHYTTARRITALVLMGVYFALPWIPINGYPAVFLDVAARRFHLFGLTFAAQDLWLLFFVITGLGFSLFFVTALFGRVWCGWACPQTVFLDHVFRRIEKWIDGDAAARRRLRAAPLSADKAARRIAKHILFIAASAIITHFLLAYFVSLPSVWAMVSEAPSEHIGAFGFVAAATGLIYFNFAWFREQLCIVICPYGRIQSALIDDNSLVVGYDTRRGEPRGRRLGGGQKTEDRGQRTDTSGEPSTVFSLPSSDKPVGDCVDCSMCVQACPTGIDIRQGLQMECIGCTSCIDACDNVMTRLGRPRGLIRYDSQVGFAGGRTRWFRPRTILYFVLLMVGMSVAGWAISTIRPASLGVVRMTGAPYIVDTSTVRNQYLVRLVNKLNDSTRLRVTVSGSPAGVRITGFDAPVEVGPLGESVTPLIIQQPRQSYVGPFAFKVNLSDDSGKPLLSREVEFLGPEPRLLREEDNERK